MRIAHTALPTARSAASAATLLVLATTATGAPGLRAQTPGHEPAVVEVPSSTRAMALGHAYQVDAPDADAIFYNPALLGAAAGSVMAGVHFLGDRALGFTLSTARDWFDGSVGVGLQFLEYGSPGAGLRAGGLDPVVAEGPESAAEAAATLGLSRTLFGFRVGVAGKVVAQRFPDYRQTSGALDVGIARGVGPFRAAVAVRDIGPDRRVARDREAPQPLRTILSLGGYGQQVGPLDVGFATALTVRNDEEVLFGGGLEVAYWPVIGRTFIVRVGGRTVPEGDALPLTFGAAYHGDELVLSWAYQDMDDLDDVHRISVGWR